MWKKGNISSNSSNSINVKSGRSNMDDSCASLQVIAKQHMDIKAEKEQKKIEIRSTTKDARR
jgi:hypothetical protein